MFQEFPELKRQLWGGEYWSDGHYIGTVSGRGDRNIIENYIKNQGREADIKQVKIKCLTHKLLFILGIYHRIHKSFQLFILNLADNNAIFLKLFSI